MPERYLFTTDDYHRMVETCILTPDSRVELIRGEVVVMSAINARHAACVARLSESIFDQVRKTVCIRVQSPIEIADHSEPEPDLVLARRREDQYVVRHPKPEEILLVVEVCDTSIDRDREVKVPLYAEAGIGEVWLVNLTRDEVEVYRDPEDARYMTIVARGPGDSLSPRSLTGLRIDAARILG
jgi:Uma2 family endonuclease